MESASLKDLYSGLQEKYLNDIENMKRNSISIPAHYYSFHVYLAFNNCWKIILRHKVTPGEILIMKQLSIYKPSRSERGTRRKPTNACIVVK